MAFSTGVIWEVRPSSGSDNNGGGFDPAQTGGMATDGAATSGTGSSPVFSSASYSFVSGDVGSWVYISSGTNWIPGFYQIASVSGGNATLSAGVGAAFYLQGSFSGGTRGFLASTTQGVASTSSPSSATWSLDKSQSNSPYANHTDLAGASGNKVSSASYTFTVADVGNTLSITAGTSFTTGYYTITSVSSGSAVLDRNPGSSGTSGTYFLGGALSSFPNLINNFVSVNQNVIFVKATATISTSSAIQLGGGRSSSIYIYGYSSTRTDQGIVSLSSTLSTNSMLFECDGIGNQGSGDYGFYLANFAITESGSGTGTMAFAMFPVGPGFGGGVTLDNCLFSGFANVWTGDIYNLNLIDCSFKSCTSDVITLGNANSMVYSKGCLFSGNSGSGIINTQFGNQGSITCIDCVFYQNGYGVRVIGGQFNGGSQMVTCNNCAFDGNTHDGINTVGGGTNYAQTVTLLNNIFWNNGGYGVNVVYANASGRNNAFGSNSSGARNNFNALPGDFTITANPWIADSTGNWTLNATSGGGLLCVGAGFQSTLLT